MVLVMAFDQFWAWNHCQFLSREHSFLTFASMKPLDIVNKNRAVRQADRYRSVFKVRYRWQESVDVGVRWMGEVESVSVSGGQVETVVAVLALVCLTWPGFDWQMLWFIESVCYCHLCLFCCFPECPRWNDFDCVTEIWSERGKTCGKTDSTV